jgi:hypothetical protein
MTFDNKSKLIYEIHDKFNSSCEGLPISLSGGYIKHHFIKNIYKNLNKVSRRIK